MKLNADELNVESFETVFLPEEDTIITSPNDPTPATRCRWCPEQTFTCP